MSSFIFFLSFLFFFITNCHLLSLFLNLGVTLSLNLSCVSPLTQTLEMSLLYRILKVTDTLSPNLSCVSLLTQTFEMSLFYGIPIVTDRLQPPHLSFLFSINFQLFSLYKLISMALNGIVSWVFFRFFQSWLKSIYQYSIKWVQETDSDSRACRRNCNRWEVNISSPSPKGINPKWVLLFS